MKNRIDNEIKSFQQDLKRAEMRNNFLKASNYEMVQEFAIEKIPLVRTLFPGTKDDWWFLLEDLSKATGKTCIHYEMAKGSIFPAHKHTGRLEQFILISKAAHVRVITRGTNDKKGLDFELKFPNSYLFEEDEGHMVEGITRAKFICIFDPAFPNHGWQAEV